MLQTGWDSGRETEAGMAWLRHGSSGCEFATHAARVLEQSSVCRKTFQKQPTYAHAEETELQIRNLWQRVPAHLPRRGHQPLCWRDG